MHCRLKEHTHDFGHQWTRPAFIMANVWNFCDPLVKRQLSDGSSFIARNVSYTPLERPASKRKQDEFPMSGILRNSVFRRSTQLWIMHKKKYHLFHTVTEKNLRFLFKFPDISLI